MSVKYMLTPVEGYFTDALARIWSDLYYSFFDWFSFVNFELFSDDRYYLPTFFNYTVISYGYPTKLPGHLYLSCKLVYHILSTKYKLKWEVFYEKLETSRKNGQNIFKTLLKW